ncbi:uncharacterized protein LOC128557813 isoform X2 [Mercenaria mercenaria]|uniref:uncharacterized protein LOC128557813 isoform X2 n=1 Tax=Mercenaria mercenaria TaxID=6596 RepID=UPI00234F361B|nr:uncharacterized protein LOC128557813 isoform X2 [Mercenaria mercenaria]
MNVVKRSFLTTFFLFINCHCSVINIAGTKPWSGCTQATKTDLNCRFIPKDIPDGIKRVYLQQEETGRPLPKVVTKGMFTAKNWNEIEYLEFKYEHNPLKKIDSNGLSNLLNLRELHVHADFLDELHSDAFVGLGKLQVLDLSTCPSLSTGNLMQALNGSDKLPNMQKLSIVWMNSYYGGIEIGPEMYEILRTKQLKSLDISNCDIAFLDLQGIQKLTKLQRVIATSIKLARYAMGPLLLRQA